MIVLSYLSPQAFARLCSAFGPAHSVSNAPTWEALLGIVGSGSADVLVIDPCVGGDHLAADRIRSLVAAVASPSTTAIVAYLSVTAAALHVVPSLVRLGPMELVVRGVDDSANGLLSAAQRAASACSAKRLVRAVGNRFEALPHTVATALEQMFLQPERVRTVPDLARAARTTRRSLDRWLARAGLAPARTLLACARANAAFHLITTGPAGRSRAAERLGYVSPRALAREMQALTGFTPSAIPVHLSYDAFVSVVGPRLRRASGNGEFAASSY